MKHIKKTIVILFNPLSPIIILIVGCLLSIIIAVPDERFPESINALIKNPIIIFVFLIFWLLFSIVYSQSVNTTKELIDKLKQKDEIIKQKENHLNHTTGIILNKSGDFAEFNKLLRFKSVLKGFVNNNTIVESAQIYNYSSKRILNKVIIKILYEAGYAYEYVDINNLAQTHYEINYEDYNKIKDIIKIWKDLSNNNIYNVSQKDTLIKFATGEIISIYKKYYENLVKISDINDIKLKHFTEYRIITLLTRLARRASTTTFDKNNLLGLPKNEIEEYLLNGKRTGILNSILLEDTFMFKYTRNSHRKDGRAYICFHINIANQNYIVSFSIQTIDLDNSIDLEQEIFALKMDFINRINDG